MMAHETDFDRLTLDILKQIHEDLARVAKALDKINQEGIIAYPNQTVRKLDNQARQ